MADTTLETLRQLRDHAAAVLAVIDARGLEGAQHISPKSALADQCRHELETASHDLRILFALPRAPRQPGNVPKVLAFPFDALTVEQHSIAQAADGLLFDAYVGLFSGESYEQRKHYGTTTVSPIVCKQLREGIALLDGIVEKKTESTTWHEADATPPSEYSAGPLIGTKKQLVKWIMQKSDHRLLDTPLKKGTFWGRQDAKEQCSIWFKKQERYSEANGKRLADPS